MPTVGIDHIAMPTADAERLIAFYKGLGFTINDEEAWRVGKANIFSIQMGDAKINVHPEGYMARLRGPCRTLASARTRHTDQNVDARLRYLKGQCLSLSWYN